MTFFQKHLEKNMRLEKFREKSNSSQETLDRTLYKSSTEQLYMRAVEERIKHNLTSCYSALMPREY